MRPQRRPQRHYCCIVWVAVASGLARGCIHCHRVIDRRDWAGSHELLEHLAEQSLAGHAAICPIPVRQEAG